MKSGENWSGGFREARARRLKFTQFYKYIYSPGARADNTRGDKILTVTKKSYYFNHTLHISL